LAALELDGLKRTPEPTHRLDGLWVERQGRRLLSFSCNDYLGLSHHPTVKQAAADAARTYGAGAGASRLVTGDCPLIPAVEQRLARLKGTEAACVFASGYMANVGVVPVLAGPGDVILIDALAHSCLWAGARLSGAAVVRFDHNDVGHLGALLGRRRDYRHALVLTDGVFSMDGDLAPLDRLSELCEAHAAWLMVDDAHGLGVVGGGRGALHEFPGARVPLQMGTLSKAVGGLGGYLCASQPVIDLIKTRARTLVYSTGLAPACAGAAIAALDLIAASPALCATPLAKARAFTTALGLPPAQSAIVPIIIGEAAEAMAASARLMEQGFLAAAIRPPTVPAGTARLRLAFAAPHPDEAVLRLAEAIRPLLA
jgi:8-amino-7-oxononanoate synthase